MKTILQDGGAARRGVLLIVVLGLLAAFGLIGITFVILTSHERRGAEAQRRVDVQYTPSAKLLNRAVMELLRGSNNPSSPVRVHSLLEDVYGQPQWHINGVDDDSDSVIDEPDEANEFVFYISSVDPPLQIAGGQLLQTRIQRGTTAQWVPTSAYVGCVVTMLEGPAAGLSTRIVGVNPTQPPVGPQFAQLLAFPGGKVPMSGNRLVINLPAFGGTGVGYNPNATTTELLTATGMVNGTSTASWSLALTPNVAGFKSTGEFNELNAATGVLPGVLYYSPCPAGGIDYGLDPTGSGLANEPYDAPDYQNMFLAWQWPIASGAIPPGTTPLPSFHRPELVDYWLYRNGSELGLTGASETTWSNWLYVDRLNAFVNTSGVADPVIRETLTNLKRRILLRPLSEDHPDFTGSNAQFLPSWDGYNQVMLPSGKYATWDVDNDGDGINDSIWIDLGMPIQTTPDGRKFKPLFAFLCVDLDGRLNVNAHGCLAQTRSDYYGSVTIDKNNNDAARFGMPVFDDATKVQATVPRGQGFGPAEINLRPLFNGNFAAYEQLLLGKVDNTIPGNPVYTDGRYGESTFLLADHPELSPVGRWVGVDPVEGNLLSAYPADQPTDTNYITDITKVLGVSGTPMDLKGGIAVALDPLGQPVYAAIKDRVAQEADAVGSRAQLGNALAAVKADHPYELDLTLTGSSALKSPSPTDSSGTAWPSTDNPFTPSELERLLRAYDIDSSMLPDRLVKLAPTLGDHRREVTTLSNDVPATPGALSPRWLYEGLSAAQKTELQTAMANSVIGIGVPVRSTPLVLKALVLKQLALANVPATDMVTLQTSGALDTYLKTLFPAELLANLPMDLNRPFGNGRDDGGNGEVDEPGDSDGTNVEPGTYLNAAMGAASTGSLALARGVDVNKDGTVNAADNLLARQLYARHLFVLAMLLRDAGYIEPTTEAGLTHPQQEELTTRRLAQWAVNVADFRDPDAIMTPFEYDTNPFVDENGDGNPWDVDGVVEPLGSTSPNPDDTQSYRRLVWGCEQPELLITETFAGHDLAIADTARDDDMDKVMGPSPTDDDQTADQVRIPQGSAFIELFCVRNANHNNGVAPGSLYTYDATSRQWVLDLAKPAPPNPAAFDDRLKRAYPVWRLAISPAHWAAGSNLANSVMSQLDSFPNTTAVEPQQFTGDPIANRNNLLPSGGGATAIPIERIVWFTTATPDATSPTRYYDVEKVFWNQGGTGTLLLPGQYAVVGPGPRTRFGAVNAGTVQPGPGSLHRIELSATGVNSKDPLDGSLYPNATDIRAPLAIIAAAAPPAAWVSAGWPEANRIGLNISEPMPNETGAGAEPYYPKPTHASGRNGSELDAYCDLSDASAGLRDTPLDIGTKLEASVGFLVEGTTLNYKTVLLQRLANPLAPYDPMSNPYVTVDWMPFDLNMFNGEGTVRYAKNDDQGKADIAFFRSRERGFFAANQVGLWRPPMTLENGNPATSGDPPSDDAPMGTANTYQKRPLLHTLGFLNSTFHSPRELQNYHNRIETAAPNRSKWRDPATTPAPYIGAPNTDRTFSWLTWNNRPYANHLELTMVPSSSAARLFGELGPYDPTDATKPNPFDSDIPATAMRPRAFGAMYGGLPSATGGGVANGVPGALPNFFAASNQASTSADNRSAQLYRLLEFVRVPSRFAGTQLQGDPSNFSAAPLAGQEHGFAPPFNWISNYREPGLINLNTISSPSVWQGVTNYFPDMNPSSPVWRWGEFAWSRRGYGSPESDSMLFQSRLDTTDHLPTRFAHPFRPASSAAMVPLEKLMQVKAPDASVLNTTDVDTTLLRRTPRLVDASPTNPDRPLFGLNFATEATNNPGDNPYYYYQGLERLGNMTTCRSNVYAVWVTVGYFEVHPRPLRRHADGSEWTDPEYKAVYPDGHALGQELDSDTGQTQRHRAFYLIDRSVPVGFQRGQDLNAEKAILLRRFVE